MVEKSVLKDKVYSVLEEIFKKWPNATIDKKLTTAQISWVDGPSMETVLDALQKSPKNLETLEKDLEIVGYGALLGGGELLLLIRTASAKRTACEIFRQRKIFGLEESDWLRTLEVDSRFFYRCLDTLEEDERTYTETEEVAASLYLDNLSLSYERYIYSTKTMLADLLEPENAQQTAKIWELATLVCKKKL